MAEAMKFVPVTLNDCEAHPDPAPLSKGNKDKVRWHAVDGDYEIDFRGGSPFEGPDKFPVYKGQLLEQDIADATQTEQNYKYHMTCPSGEVIDPTIFIDL